MELWLSLAVELCTVIKTGLSKLHFPNVWYVLDAHDTHGGCDCAHGWSATVHGKLLHLPLAIVNETGRLLVTSPVGRVVVRCVARVTPSRGSPELYPSAEILRVSCRCPTVDGERETEWTGARWLRRRAGAGRRRHQVPLSTEFSTWRYSSITTQSSYRSY